ncbi:multistep phosphorelay regulator 1 [Rhizoctonia solani]|uniref:Multistep phosphorelay regulator 1 n=1 Tax=Rhizoctonia solani TaxID=456999 RepID=A0A8H8SVR4_9AGAM|nr:multistep phosphorelay regulator 1 [Rhizoctonia solani]QRW20246.1 multistep phosphorelay regulator 1 [Rhizoctonia solani]
MSAPTSPSAARRFTSPPPPTSPPAVAASPVPVPASAAATPASPAAARAGSVKPATPRSQAATPAPISTQANSQESEDGKAIETLDIDESVFNQITEMDEEDDCEFSSDIVRDYFKQAITTLGELNDALNQKDFATLSSKGHFLKGSSAALGVKKVQESCEHIQHYGHKRDEIKGVDLTEPQALRRIELLMPRLEKDYESAKAWLINYYSNRGVDLEEDE